MASAAYTAWLAQFATSRVVLAELQPAEQLTAWTRSASYADRIIADGPSAYWRLNSSTTNMDSSGNGRTLTTVGAPTFAAAGPLADGTTTVTGFTGSNYFHAGADAAWQRPAMFSIEAWTYRENGGSWQVVLVKTSNNSWLDGYGLTTATTSTAIRFWINRYDGSGDGGFCDSAPLAESTWHHIVATYDGTTGTLYVDGAQVGTFTPSGSIRHSTTANRMRVGWDDGGNAWSRDLANVGFYPRALSPSEVAEHYALRTSAVGLGTAVYQKTWAVQAESDVVKGGIYRRLDGVRQNATALTSRASALALDAASEGYYQDTANSLVYVKTTGGVTPDTYAAVLALFTVFMATKPVDFVGGNLYEPRLTGTLPSVEMTTEDPLFGVKVYSSGDLILANADKLFDKLGRKWLWKNRLATIKFGGGDLAYSDYETIAVMRIDDAAPNDDVFTLNLRQMASLLEQVLPLNTISLTDYPNAGQGVAGTYKPLLYGAKTNIPAPLVDSTSGAQVYLVADPAVQVLTGVTAVRATKRDTGVVTTLTLTTHYTVNLTNCTVTVTSTTYNAGEYDIVIDATGETDGVGSYLSTGGEIAKDMLTVLGESSANIDATAFSDADADNSAPLGLWLREGKSAADYIRLIERSVFGTVYVGRDGLWRMDIWDPTYDATTIPSLVDQDFAEWKVDDKLELILYGARVKYDENPATGAWKETQSTDETVRYAYDTTEVAVVETCLIDSANAIPMAQRYRLLAGSPRMHISVRERGLSQMTAQQFDKVAVTRTRAPNEDGTYSGFVMEVLQVRKNLSPPSVELLLGNTRGFGEFVGRWADSAAPDYGTATDNERARDGYWADSDGYIVTGDAGTLNQSIWF